MNSITLILSLYLQHLRETSIGNETLSLLNLVKMVWRLEHVSWHSEKKNNHNVFNNIIFNKLFRHCPHLPISAIHGVSFPYTDDHIGRVSNFIRDPESFKLFSLMREPLPVRQCSWRVARVRFDVLGWLSVKMLKT